MCNVRLFFISLFIILSSFQVVNNNSFSGRVVAVIDGDTIEVLKGGKALRIRLNGIDCPEKSQAFGSKAKQFTSDQVFNKNVVVKEKELDRYGRTIADVYTDGGIWLNKALVDAGLAWHYKRYSSNQELATAEIKARNSKIGLWKDDEPKAPWEFRKAN
jgi:micrococcal nuclease